MDTVLLPLVLLFVIVLLVIRRLFGVLVLWNVARSGIKKIESGLGTKNLYIFLCSTVDLDDSSVSELHTFLGKFVNSDLDFKGFCCYLRSYDYVALYREKRDGSIRGISLINKGIKEFERKSYIVMEVGACYYEKHYRGSLCMFYVLAYFRLKELLCHPFTQFLLVGQLFSYKSYARMAHTFKHIYPSYHSSTPKYMRQFINSYAMQIKQEEDFYDPDMFVLKKEGFCYLKRNEAERDAADIADPDVKFFLQRNPNFDRGYQLITVVSLGIFDIICLFNQMLFKFVKGNTRKQGKLKSLKSNGILPDGPSRSVGEAIEECDSAGYFHPPFEECDLAEYFHPSITEE